MRNTNRLSAFLRITHPVLRIAYYALRFTFSSSVDRRFLPHQHEHAGILMQGRLLPNRCNLTT